MRVPSAVRAQTIAVMALVLLSAGVTSLWADDELKPWQKPATRVGVFTIGPHYAPMVWVPKGSFRRGRPVDEAFGAQSDEGGSTWSTSPRASGWTSGR